MNSLSLSALLLLFCELTAIYAYQIRLPSTLNKNDSNINLEIVNGKNTSHDSFPYQVGLLTMIKNNQGLLCGGFIVSKRFVATAAHCVMTDGQQVPAKNILLRTGLDKFWVKGKPLIPVQSVHVYPNYSITKNEVRGDLALLHLSKDIEFKDGVSSACLDYRYKEHEFLYASGYGSIAGEIYTSQGKLVQSRVAGDLLKYTKVKEERSSVFCNDSKLYVCVDSVKHGRITGICQGDSGGPLSTPQHDVLGVASTDHPGFNGEYILECVGFSSFTRLGAYAAFIDQLIGKNNYCSKR